MTNANFDMTVATETANLLSFFQKRSLMSGYLRSVLHANLFDPHQVTKPDWYDPLTKHLGALQTQAQAWFDTTSVTMTTLPQNYINFANGFDGQSDTLVTAIGDLIAGSGDADTHVDNIITLFDQLITYAHHAGKSASAEDKALKAYLIDLTAGITSLTEGAASVNTAIAVDKQAVDDITGAIKALQSQLQTDIDAAIAANSGTLAALIVLVIGIVVAVTTGGAAAIIGAVVAGVAVAGTIAGTVVTSLNIVNDQNAIIEKQRELSDENLQIVVLNGIALTVNGLLDTYKNQGFDMGDLVGTWDDLANNLAAVRNLIIAERGDPQALKAVLADINDFGTTIDALRLYAKDLQNAALSVDALPHSVVTIPTAIAA